MHVSGPGTVLYFPAAHAAHVPLSGPVNPRLQTQLVNTVAPTLALQREALLFADFGLHLTCSNNECLGLSTTTYRGDLSPILLILGYGPFAFTLS